MNHFFYSYVQHLIRQQSQLCWEYLQKGGNIYLAGNCKNMPSAVREEFVDLVKSYGEMSQEEAENFIRTLEKTDRYQSETW